MKKPLFIFDGDCGYCRGWIEKWKRLCQNKVAFRPYQEVHGTYPEISQKGFEASVQFIEVDGSRYSGAEAVFRMLSYSTYRWLLWFYQKVPGVHFISEFCYQFVARRRMFFSKLMPATQSVCSYQFSSWLFLRGLGIIYFIAFASLYVQVLGLYGSAGILPITEYFALIRDQVSENYYYLFPSWLWFNSSDAALQGLCVAGMAFSVLIVLDILTMPALLVAWTCYLSFVSLGRVFMSFQWDVLLIETGFLAIFLSSIHLFPKKTSETKPSSGILFLLKLLLFRLMFFSGLVKLSSGSEAWRKLEALNYHYETQPIPTGLSWYVHQLPEAFHKFSTVLMFVIELVIPFFLFGPRFVRRTAALALIFLQVLILLTGNYTFFNWLSIILCVLVLDDQFLSKKLKANIEKFGKRVRRFSSFSFFFRWPKKVTASICVLILLLTLAVLPSQLGMSEQFSGIFSWIEEPLRPFHLVNRYGLFAVMTTERPEIVIEGSLDGKNWRPYELKYKPGDLKRSPPWVAPHQPRLDWQMWFAALGNVYRNPWFVVVCRGLLKGNPQIEAFFESKPFQHPPKFVRAVLYRYEFSTPKEKRASGDIWKRQPVSIYLRSISLK